MMSPIHAASVSDGASKTHFVLTPASSNDSNASSNHSNGEQRSQCSSLSDGENFEWNGDGENGGGGGGGELAKLGGEGESGVNSNFGG